MLLFSICSVHIVKVCYDLLCVLYCSYYVERGVCYLVLCDKSFSKRQAFAYLEELQTEFAMQYGHKLGTVSRPYSFIEFGKNV